MSKSNRNLQYYETGKFLLDIAKLFLGFFVFSAIREVQWVVALIGFLVVFGIYLWGISLVGKKRGA